MTLVNVINGKSELTNEFANATEIIEIIGNLYEKGKVTRDEKNNIWRSCMNFKDLILDQYARFEEFEKGNLDIEKEIRAHDGMISDYKFLAHIIYEKYIAI